MGKTIAQGYREEGKIEGFQEMVLSLGRSRFGDPDSTIERAICAIDNSQRLKSLAERVYIVNSWDELLQT